MLSVEKVDVFYGEFQAVSEISLQVREGELVTIIGANGAGKSTILKALMGLQGCKSGKITFQEQDITHTLTYQRARLGITLVPEGRRLFPDLTVEQNLLIGGYTRNDATGMEKDLQRIYDIFPILKERRLQIGKTLSGGEQQMLALGRALMANPRLILMDEVSLGLMPKYVEEVFKTIEGLHGEGVTMLLVEQNARKALAVADRGYVLETGRILIEDEAQRLASDPRVKKAYLGG
ncbi:MAG: ATP-binding cassette domain-containing protein [Proteobacteria bacterium]|nr:ATP-binding cassette domain-containing protein [Pseudomonadota bacterium]